MTMSSKVQGHLHSNAI